MNRARVLIVDDMVMMREIVKRTLLTLKVEHIVEASNGIEGIAKLKQAAQANQKFDLVLLDWGMPMMSGSEMMDAVKKIPEIADTKFIIISAERDAAKIKSLLEKGALSYITKPFPKEVVMRNLNLVFNKGA